MLEMFDHFYLDWRDILDIALVSFLLYQVIQLLRGSRALAILTGFFFLGVIYMVSREFGFYTLGWLLDHVFT